MQAIRVHKFGKAEVMKIAEVNRLTPAVDQVLVEVKAAGVNPVDIYIREGGYIPQPSLPYTPGIDGAGIVRAVGKGVRKVSVGSRVYTAGSITGTYAEEVLCREDQVYLLPDKLNFEQGAGVYVPYTTAYRALFHKAQVKKGETVLVHGASGGVGIAGVQLAIARGLRVIATAGTPEGENLVKKQNVPYVLNHYSKNYREEILSLTAQKGVDIILEMAAHVNLEADINLLGLRGRIVVIGSQGEVKINPRGLMKQDGQILGLSLFNLSSDDCKQIQTALYKGFKQGHLSPEIGFRYSLDQASDAQRKLLEKGALGKIVLCVNV